MLQCLVYSAFAQTLRGSDMTMLRLSHSLAAVGPVLGLLLGSGGSPSAAEDPYSPRLLLRTERVVAATPGGYFPVLVRLRGDKLGAVLRGGAPHLGLAGRLDWVISEDGGRTWGKRRVVVDSPWDDRNPACGIMPDGTVVVAYEECHNYDEQGRYGKGPGGTRYMITRSSDEGATWTEPEPLDNPYGCPFGQMVTLDDGSILMVCYAWHSRTGLLRTTDNGETWRPLAPLPGYGETGLCRDSQGRVFAFIREDLASLARPGHGEATAERVAHYLRATVSEDGGRTWCEPVTVTYPGQHPAGACVLADRSLLLCYGQRRPPFGVGALLWDSSDAFAALLRRGQDPLPAARKALLAWDCVNTDCGYPSPVQLADGTVVVMYYNTGTFESPDKEQAQVLRFTPEALRAAADGGPVLVYADDLDRCEPAENLARWRWRTGLEWAHNGDLLHQRGGSGEEVLRYDPRLRGRHRAFLGTRAVTPSMRVRLRLSGETEWQTLELPDSEGRDHFREIEWRAADFTGRVIEIAPVPGHPAYLDYFRFVPEEDSAK